MFGVDWPAWPPGEFGAEAEEEEGKEGIVPEGGSPSRVGRRRAASLAPPRVAGAVRGMEGSVISSLDSMGGRWMN